MPKLYLVRHGETAWNREKVFRGRADIPLSERGLRQAELTGKAFSRVAVEAIYTSPLQRSLLTAQAIARQTGAPLHLEPALTDIDFGLWTGVPQAQVNEKFPELYQQWKLTPHLCQFPQGETLADVWKRTNHFARTVAPRHQDAAVIVTHRVILKAFILSALNLGPEHFWALRMDTCSISALEYNDKKVSLILLNDTCHLTGEKDAGAIDF